jgi:hypothetical protein
MKKTLLLFCLFLIAFSGKAFARKPVPDSVRHSAVNRHSIYGELLGNTGIGVSGNYESLLPLDSRKKTNLALRVGIGSFYLPLDSKSNSNTILTFPTEVSIFGGNGFFKPELGCGITLAKSPDLEYGIGGVMVVRVGVRMQNPGGHFFGKIGISNWISGMGPKVRDLHILSFPGLAFGYSF